MKVLILLHHRFELWNAPSWFPDQLRQDFPQLEIAHLATYDNVEQELRNAEVAITWSLRPEQFAIAKNLRWIHSPAAAVHQLMFPELVNSDVVITNARQVHAPVVAEHVMALLFALAKKIPQAVRLQLQHVWGKGILWEQDPRPREIADATLGLLGLGSIGREVAKRAAAVGMRVLAVRKTLEKEAPEGVARLYGDVELDEVLRQADFVVLAAPLTPQTEKLMNAERLAQLQPGAYFINVSRGALVDEIALVDALRSRKLAGAAIDVFVQEPLPENSPLWDLDNLLITPHTAAVTEKLWKRHYELVRENLRRYLGGEPLLAQVNKQKGY